MAKKKKVSAGKAGKSKFRGKVTANAHKQKTQGSSYGHLNLPKGVAMFKEEPGRCRLDILPYSVTDPKHPDRDEEFDIAVPGELWYKRPYKLHRNIGSDKDSVVCLSSVGKKCPICEYRAKLLQDGADWQDDAVKALKASNRNLYVVIPKKNKSYDEKPHLWDISQYLFQDKLNDELEENEEYGVFPDFEEGLTLRIRFAEEKLGKNSFAETSRIDFEDRDDAYDEEEMLKKIPNLDEILSISSYKELERKFMELENEEDPDDEPEDPDDEPEEDNDEPDDEPEEDEDEDEPDDELDDDEEEEEEEEEPEPEPKKTKKGTKKTTKKTETKKETKSSKKGNKKNKCPFGYEFGKDCEEYDECDECDEFENCLDAKEED